MHKRLFLISVIMVFSWSINAQQDSLENDSVLEFTVPSFKVDIIETIDWLKTNLYSINTGGFSLQTSFRIDEEVPYSESNKALLKDLYFIDFNLSYTIKNIELSFAIENIINYRSNDFEIEADYIDDYNTLLAFSHQSNALVNFSVVYNF